MGKHDDDKDRSQKNPDPSKWQKTKGDGGRHGKENPPKDDPKK